MMPPDALKLARPSVALLEAFLDSARDHLARSGDVERNREYERALADPEAYLAELDRNRTLEEPGPGLVRQDNFWLTDGTSIFGHLRLRHRLNARLERLGGHIGYDVPPLCRGQGCATRMLALGLEEAARIGLSRALLTADAANAASLRVIEKNGGRLDAEYLFEGRLTRRYWAPTGKT
jgi:predicted acetyltransferase